MPTEQTDKDSATAAAVPVASKPSPFPASLDDDIAAMAVAEVERLRSVASVMLAALEDLRFELLADRLAHEGGGLTEESRKRAWRKVDAVAVIAARAGIKGES